ncbi:MAG: indolepyruvate ferredoxin oxidoreductase subunit alpha [Candidatus Pacebacteria bacterium]|nr:indolepyruvate ferredoxin oxidoreductase subunit alpha [Candidatus Paceibacterota bacterium]
MQKEKILERKGRKISLLGNEAIARGALEAGVDFVTQYPGTPSSEVGDTFFRLKEEIKKINPLFYFEYSTNEKVALEVAAGAVFCKSRALVSMKNFGLNVASDFFFPISQIRIPGQLVILVADDPSCWSSAQSEQDTRHLIFGAKIPMLEPSFLQESKDFVIFAFQISEKFQIPVVIRHTTRVAHQSGPVVLGEIKRPKEKKFKFKKDPKRFVTTPPRVLEMKVDLIKRMEKIREVSEKSSLNKIFNQSPKSKFGIITSGVGFCYTMEALKNLNLKIPVLKLGFVFPLPKKKIKKFLENKRQILIVEEGDPFLEEKIKEIAFEAKWKGEIFGKESSFEGGRIWKERKTILPSVGEIKSEYVEEAILKILNKKSIYKKHLKEFLEIKVPKRVPLLCTNPPCPYWAIVGAIKKVLNPEEVIFGGEIGCYMLFSHKIISLQDYLFCMGSDIGIADGISKRSNQKIVAFVGDSSFFHASIPQLINSSFNESSPLIIILENQTTAMTGHQPQPGSKIKIEEIVKACKIKHLKVIDQVKNPKELEETIREFIKLKGPKVIVARHICALLEKKLKNRNEKR